jgi:hypothetical protein
LRCLTGATIQSDEDPKGFEKWWIEAAFLAFGKIRTEEQRKRSHHAPVNVTPLLCLQVAASWRSRTRYCPRPRGGVGGTTSGST